MPLHHRWVISKLVLDTASFLLLCENMDSPSESSASSSLALHVEDDIRNIKQKLKSMNRLLQFMDTDGERRLENVDQDMIQLRKEFELRIYKIEQLFIRFLA